MKRETSNYHEIEGIAPVAQETPYSCGIGALETIFRHYGGPVGGHLGLITEAGTSHEDIRRVASACGFVAVSFRGSIESVKALVLQGIPVLVNYQDYGPNDGENGHYAVIYGYTDIDFKIADPAADGLRKRIEYDEFDSRWNDKDAPRGERYRWAAIVIPKGRTKDAIPQ